MTQTSSSHQQKAIKILFEFLESEGWHPEKVKEPYRFRLYFKGEHGEFRCYTIIHPKFPVFLFYAVVPNSIPEEKRSAVAEFIARANYGLLLCNFELNYDDGEVRVKSSFDFENHKLSVSMVKQAMTTSLRALDRYTPGIMAVAFGDKTPEATLAAVEDYANHLQ